MKPAWWLPEEPQGLFSLGALESTAAVRIPLLLAGYNQRYLKFSSR